MTSDDMDTERLEDDAASNARSVMALTFELHGEMLAVEVINVHEVIDPLPVTLVPNADPFAPGLINVRGAVVTVLNLPHRLGLSQIEHSPDTRFIVLEAVLGDDRAKFAIVADRVHEVVEIETDSILPAPELGIHWPADFIRGISQRDGRLVIVLETQAVFAPQLAA